MNKSFVVALLMILVVISIDPAVGQLTGKIPRIGIFFIGGRNQLYLEAFK